MEWRQTPDVSTLAIAVERYRAAIGAAPLNKEGRKSARTAVMDLRTAAVRDRLLGGIRAWVDPKEELYADLHAFYRDVRDQGSAPVAQVCRLLAGGSYPTGEDRAAPRVRGMLERLGWIIGLAQQVTNIARPLYMSVAGSSAPPPDIETDRMDDATRAAWREMREATRAVGKEILRSYLSVCCDWGPSEHSGKYPGTGGLGGLGGHSLRSAFNEAVQAGKLEGLEACMGIRRRR